MMETNILFHEKQYFRQWWLWLLIALIIGFIVYEIFIEKDYGTTGSLLGTAPLLLLLPFIIGLWFIHMETKITKEGIYISFYPLLLKTKFYPWSTIKNVQIKKYKFYEYGGWGIRLGAYNVSGTNGFEVEFKKDTKLLIGTQQSEKIQNIINQLFSNDKTTT